MPGYGILPADEGRGLLRWSWAEERLVAARNYWVATTRPDNRPHLMAVWGLWLAGAFYFSTGADSRKARNLAQNGACSISTEGASEAVIVEGIAELVERSRFPSDLAQLYESKYRFALPSGSPVYRVVPRVVFGFIEDAEEFGGAATRWEFSA